MSKLVKISDDIIVAKPWSEFGVTDNPVRNTDQQYLKFINPYVFNEEARHFLRYGYYIDAPKGTRDYDEYWDEQEKRILEGYSVGGVRIPGRLYYYLNFGMIKARPVDPLTHKESSTRKILTFPKFLDHIYYLSNEVEKSFAEGPYIDIPKQGMIIAKSRRKGITFFTANGIFSYNFNFLPASNNILAAYEKQHYKATLDAIHFTLNHVNKHTAFAKRRDKLDKRDHFRASFIYVNEEGIEIEEGYMSEIQAVSYKDNPFKNIGESVDVIGVEEAGRFRELLEAYAIFEPTIRDGDIMTGVPFIYGTGGDMEDGTQDFAEMFYNPAPYGLRAYQNIYDENAVGDCGWFIDDMWYYPGTYVKKVTISLPDGTKQEKEELYEAVDLEGNSIRDIAEKLLDEKAELRKKTSRQAYLKFLTQQPKTPAQAFLRISGNVFDAARCNARLGEIMANPNKYLSSIYRAALEIDVSTGGVKFTHDTVNQPIYDFPIRDNKNKPGCIEIYEHPVLGQDGKPISGRYIAGIDSYDKDVSSTVSLGSLLVLDTYTDRIVCHYKGRPPSNVFYENCRRILKYYGAVANYERSNLGIYTYFYNHNSLHLLADEPEILSEKGLSTGNLIGNNKKGTAPSEKVNALGIELAMHWLSRPAYGYDQESEVTNYDILRSVPLLKELAAWNDKGNFDDVSALGMLMIYREDKVKTITKLVKNVKTIRDDPFWSRHVGKVVYSQYVID